MLKEGFLVAIFFCLFSAITASAFDNAWFTYVDRVEPAAARDRRAINQPATQSPLEETTRRINETETVLDNHDYYEIQYKDSSEAHWMDISTIGSPLIISERLSSTSRHAVKVLLNFTFPFYGYDTPFLHVTSSGFLYVGSYSHRYLAATQYVAPLMADFDPSIHNGSTISYYGDNSMFVAEWRNLRLQKDQTGQNFTFQAIIYKNGTTVFSYKEKPMSIAAISTKDHPVKVGLADAYYHDTWIIQNVVSRRVIYEYHSVDVPFKKVDNFSTIIFKPLETCTGRMTCETCTQSPPDGFVCAWCSALNKCSDGFDRHRQAWLKQNCDKKNQTECSADTSTGDKGKPTAPTTASVLPGGPSKTVPKDNYGDLCLTMDCGPGTCVSNKCICPKDYFGQHCQTKKDNYHGDLCLTMDCGPGTCVSNKCICPNDYFGQHCQTKKDIGNETSPQHGSSHAPAVVFFLFVMIMVIVLIAWVLYAYKNPNTSSGLYLIRITRCYCFQRSSGAAPSYKYEKTGVANI